MPKEPFDASRARLSGPDQFQRFRVPDVGKPLLDAHLNLREDIIVVERRGLSRALLVSELSYHHLAQGRLGGEPYLVSF
jgi:hypothetical protein